MAVPSREGAAKSTERTLEGLRAAMEEAEARALERRRGVWWGGGTPPSFIRTLV